ncbi:hypothetical protein ACVWZD_005013 [Streptomyces sp. TE3672]
MLRSSDAFRTPSSQIRSIPEVVAAEPSPRRRVSASHRDPALSVVLVTASASRADSVRRTVVPSEERTSARADPAAAPR